MPWNDCWGRPVPRQEIEFLCQSFVLTVVIVVSLYNLTVTPQGDCKEALWASLLSACVGIACPGPVIKWRSRGGEEEEEQQEGGDSTDGRRDGGCCFARGHPPQPRQPGRVPEQQDI